MAWECACGSGILDYSRGVKGSITVVGTAGGWKGATSG